MVTQRTKPTNWSPQARTNGHTMKQTNQLELRRAPTVTQRTKPTNCELTDTHQRSHNEPNQPTGAHRHAPTVIQRTKPTNWSAQTRTNGHTTNQTNQTNQLELTDGHTTNQTNQLELTDMHQRSYNEPNQPTGAHRHAATVTQRTK